MMQSFPKEVKDYVFLDFDEDFGADSGPDSIEEILYHRFDLDDPLEESKEENEAQAPETDGFDGGGSVNREPTVFQGMSSIEEVLRNAESQAESIISEAMAAAEKMKNDARVEATRAVSEAEKKGYDEGFEKGLEEGRQKGLEESRIELQEQNRSLLDEVSIAIAELERQKTDYIRQYNEEMKDLVIAIAEKVIKISLKSSSEIIRRMIIAAVESSYQKQWAKIYISDYDANLMVREDADILDALKNVSDKIKIVVMENGEPGDLMIEYPDQAIDAGVNTQIENIREIMESTR